MSRARDVSRVEAPRDQAESSFTRILRRFGHAQRGVLAAVFVDRDGECVDYWSSLPPFDAKIMGAHMQIVLDLLKRHSEKPGWGEPYGLSMMADARDIHFRRVGDEYLLVVAVRAGWTTLRLLDAIHATGDLLRREAHAKAPVWDPLAGPVEVETRGAVGWDYAPAAYRDAGKRIEITDVLGRWVDSEEMPGVDLVCFRVRTATGAELTLVHDGARGRWLKK